MMSQDSVCPVLSMGNDFLEQCLNERCAWFVGDRCAVAVIALAADELSVAAENQATLDIWKVSER